MIPFHLQAFDRPLVRLGRLRGGLFGAAGLRQGGWNPDAPSAHH
jgi:hypothetical protein